MPSLPDNLSYTTCKARVFSYTLDVLQYIVSRTYYYRRKEVQRGYILPLFVD